MAPRGTMAPAPSILVLLSMPALASAFVAPLVGSASVARPHAPPQATALSRAARPPPAGSSDASAASSICGTAATLFALGGLAAAGVQRRRRSKVGCKAFGSAGSGFMGAPTYTAFAVEQTTTMVPQADASRSGVAGMEMKNQVWWIQNNGFDGRSGKIFDSRRRESRRRGEELYMHDVDNFELTLGNLKGAPGSRKRAIRRGRGKFGHHGRTCGFGNGGMGKRGRRTLNPWYEGGMRGISVTTPKLDKAQLDSMKRDPYTMIKLKVLNMCEDGDEVDYMDLWTRGLPVRKIYKFDKFKVKGTMDEEFTTKNLTVYAHAFEPAAREKIEELGGKCIRLHEWSGLPLDGLEDTTVKISSPEEK